VSVSVNLDVCGPHFNAVCSKVSLSSGSELPWLCHMRYRGVRLVRQLKNISLRPNVLSIWSHIFGKLGSFASRRRSYIWTVKDRMFTDFTARSRVCPVNSYTDISSFVITRVFMKLFQTKHIDTIKH